MYAALSACRLAAILRLGIQATMKGRGWEEETGTELRVINKGAKKETEVARFKATSRRHFVIFA